MSRLLDVCLGVLVGGIGLVCLIVEAGLLRGVRVPRRARRIVYLGTGQIAQVFPRNGVNLFLERECSDFGGYFEQMWNVHFPAGTRGSLDLTPRHHLIDVDFPLPGHASAAQWRVLATLWREVRFPTALAAPSINLNP